MIKFIVGITVVVSLFTVSMLFLLAIKFGDNFSEHTQHTCIRHRFIIFRVLYSLISDWLSVGLDGDDAEQDAEAAQPIDEGHQCQQVCPAGREPS